VEGCPSVCSREESGHDRLDTALALVRLLGEVVALMAAVRGLRPQSGDETL
jgi:hypothetical protein